MEDPKFKTIRVGLKHGNVFTFDGLAIDGYTFEWTPRSITVEENVAEILKAKVARRVIRTVKTKGEQDPLTGEAVNTIEHIVVDTKAQGFKAQDGDRPLADALIFEVLE